MERFILSIVRVRGSTDKGKPKGKTKVRQRKRQKTMTEANKAQLTEQVPRGYIIVTH